MVGHLSTYSRHARHQVSSTQDKHYIIRFTGHTSRSFSINEKTFRFTIDGIEYVLKPEDYVLQITDQGQTQCISAFMGLDMPESYGESYL